MIDVELAPAPQAPGGASANARIRAAGPILGLVLCYIAFSLINPRMLSIGTLTSIVEISAIPIVIAVGLTFVVLLGAIDLSVEGIMAACVMVVSILVANDQNARDMGLIGVLMTLLLGVALGLINGLLHTVLKIPSFIATLGVWFVGLGVATVVSAGVTPTIQDKATLSLAVQRWSSLSELSIVAVAVVILGYALQRFTRFGRYTMAIGGNETVAVLSGVRVARFKVFVFTFAGTCYGLAGVMLAASLRSGNLTSSRGYLFSVIAAVVVGGTALTGGRGGVLHSVVGVLLITVINTGMVFAGVSPLMQRAVEGVIIIGVVAAAMWSARGRVRVVK